MAIEAAGLEEGQDVTGEVDAASSSFVTPNFRPVQNDKCQ